MAATPRESWSQAREGKYLTSYLPRILCYIMFMMMTSCPSSLNTEQYGYIHVNPVLSSESKMTTTAEKKPLIIFFQFEI